MEHYAVVILNNILTNFFPYRKITPIPNDILTDRSKMIADFASRGYITINGTSQGRGNRKNMVVALISETSDYIKGTASAKTLINQLINSYNRTSDLDEIILIITNDMFEKKTTLTTIENETVHGTMKYDPDGKNFYITIAPYACFVMNIPSMTCEHRFASKEEIADLEKFYTTLNMIPTIVRHDSPIIWLGGKVGQVVIISRSSQTSIMSQDIRRIK